MNTILITIDFTYHIFEIINNILITRTPYRPTIGFSSLSRGWSKLNLLLYVALVAKYMQVPHEYIASVYEIRQ